MKKVLIYKSESDLKPIGGPNGYLYNLYSGLSNVKSDEVSISFLPIKNESPLVTKIINCLKKHKKLLFNVYIRYLSINKGNSSAVDFSDYDIIHFHATTDYYVCRNKLKKFKGKIIITSHSPMPCHQELIDNLQLKNIKKRNKYTKMVEKIDLFAFNNADYILFPCKEAEECYSSAWDKYKDIKKKNELKYIYVPTGLIPININESKNLIRKKYNIPENDFVVCYVGRHNEVKGYSSLKEMGEKYLSDNENSYFLIAGLESPMKGLNNSKWREIGWTNKPHEIIKAADVFVLPNKETYFDLILLEVLSIGKPIVLTKTGGNKYFKKFKDSGLYLYDYNNYDQFKKILDKLSDDDLEKIGAKNKKIFDENFSADIFAKNYIELYEKIAKELDI